MEGPCNEEAQPLANAINAAEEGPQVLEEPGIPEEENAENAANEEPQILMPTKERARLAAEDTWRPSASEQYSDMPDCFERSLKMLFDACNRKPPTSYRELSDLIEKVRNQHFIPSVAALERPDAVEMADFLDQLKEIVESQLVCVYPFDIQNFLWLVERSLKNLAAGAQRKDAILVLGSCRAGKTEFIRELLGPDFEPPTETHAVFRGIATDTSFIVASPGLERPNPNEFAAIQVVLTLCHKLFPTIRPVIVLSGRDNATYSYAWKFLKRVLDIWPSMDSNLRQCSFFILGESAEIKTNVTKMIRKNWGPKERVNSRYKALLACIDVRGIVLHSGHGVEILREIMNTEAVEGDIFHVCLKNSTNKMLIEQVEEETHFIKVLLERRDYAYVDFILTKLKKLAKHFQHVTASYTTFSARCNREIPAPCQGLLTQIQTVYTTSRTVFQENIVVTCTPERVVTCITNSQQNQSDTQEYVTLLRYCYRHAPDHYRTVTTYVTEHVTVTDTIIQEQPGQVVNTLNGFWYFAGLPGFRRPYRNYRTTTQNYIINHVVNPAYTAANSMGLPTCSNHLHTLGVFAPILAYLPQGHYCHPARVRETVRITVRDEMCDPHRSGAVFACLREHSQNPQVVQNLPDVPNLYNQSRIVSRRVYIQTVSNIRVYQNRRIPNAPACIIQDLETLFEFQGTTVTDEAELQHHIDFGLQMVRIEIQNLVIEATDYITRLCTDSKAVTTQQLAESIVALQNSSLCRKHVENAYTEALQQLNAEVYQALTLLQRQLDTQDWRYERSTELARRMRKIGFYKQVLKDEHYSAHKISDDVVVLLFDRLSELLAVPVREAKPNPNLPKFNQLRAEDQETPRPNYLGKEVTSEAIEYAQKLVEEARPNTDSPVYETAVAATSRLMNETMKGQRHCFRLMLMSYYDRRRQESSESDLSDEEDDLPQPGDPGKCFPRLNAHKAFRDESTLTIDTEAEIPHEPEFTDEEYKKELDDALSNKALLLDSFETTITSNAEILLNLNIKGQKYGQGILDVYNEVLSNYKSREKSVYADFKQAYEALLRDTMKSSLDRLSELDSMFSQNEMTPNLYGNAKADMEQLIAIIQNTPKFDDPSYRTEESRERHIEALLRFDNLVNDPSYFLPHIAPETMQHFRNNFLTWFENEKNAAFEAFQRALGNDAIREATVPYIILCSLKAEPEQSRLTEVLDEFIDSKVLSTRTENECVNAIIVLKNIAVNMPSHHARANTALEELVRKRIELQWNMEQIVETLKKHEFGSQILEEHSVFQEQYRKWWEERTSVVNLEKVLEAISGEEVKEQLRSSHQAVVSEFESIISDTLTTTQSLEQYENGLVSDIQFLETKLDPENSLQSIELKKLIGKLFGLWSLKGVSNLPRADLSADCFRKPHPSQIVAIFRLLGAGYTEPDPASGALVQIPTGEGKSIIIAIAASVLAFLGYEVYCLCFSSYLKTRDSEQFESFLQKLGIHQRVSYITYYEWANRQFQRHGNVFAKVKQIVGASVDSTDEKKPLQPPGRGVVCIHDEVDVLVTSDVYSKEYVRVSVVQSPVITEFFKYLWQNRTRSWTAETVKRTELFQHCVAQCPQLEHHMVTHLDEIIESLRTLTTPDYKPEYVVFEGKLGYKELDSINVHQIHGYITVFGYFREWENGRVSETVRDEHVGFILGIGDLSLFKYLMSSTQILGVTATYSQLSEAEKEVLEQKCGIKRVTELPSIFGESLRKFDPVQHVRSVTPDTFFTEIAKSIQAHREQPIVIYFKDTNTLNEFQEYAAAQSLPQTVQTLTEETSNAERTSLIKQGVRIGYITLATPACARGIDFKCSPNSSGLHVIQTFVSSTLSEESQIRGRAARQGVPGSYEILLKATEEFPVDKGNLYEAICQSRETVVPEKVERMFRLHENTDAELQQFMNGETAEMAFLGM